MAERSAFNQVLEDRQVQDIIINPDLDRSQKTRELRAYLRQRRFPHIVEADDRFEYQRKQLDLGNDIKIIYQTFPHNMILLP